MFGIDYLNHSSEVNFRKFDHCLGFLHFHLQQLLKRCDKTLPKIKKDLFRHENRHFLNENEQKIGSFTHFIY